MTHLLVGQEYCERCKQLVDVYLQGEQGACGFCEATFDIKQHLIGTCVSNPFGDSETLDEVVEGAEPIERDDFFLMCAISDAQKSDMLRYPNDYKFMRYNEVYFYEWSAIEYFYQ